MAQTVIRPATEADVDAILNLVNQYARQNVMLPRLPGQIRVALDRFVVAENDGVFLGCASLIELTPDLPEIRSLAVAPEARGMGVGRLLVETLVARAREMGYPQVCALTLEDAFFNRVGFETVDRWTISPKIWLECIYCPKYNACDEIAVLMRLKEPAPAEEGKTHSSMVRLGVLRRGLAMLRSGS